MRGSGLTKMVIGAEEGCWMDSNDGAEVVVVVGVVVGVVVVVVDDDDDDDDSAVDPGIVSEKDVCDELGLGMEVGIELELGSLPHRSKI